MRVGFGASVKWSRTLVAPEQSRPGRFLLTPTHQHMTHPSLGGHQLSDKGMWSPKCASSLKFCDMALVMQQNTFVPSFWWLLPFELTLCLNLPLAGVNVHLAPWLGTPLRTRNLKSTLSSASPVTELNNIKSSRQRRQCEDCHCKVESYSTHTPIWYCTNSSFCESICLHC